MEAEKLRSPVLETVFRTSMLFDGMSLIKMLMVVDSGGGCDFSSWVKSWFFIQSRQFHRTSSHHDGTP